MGKEINLEIIKQGLKYYKRSSGEGTEFRDVCIMAENLVRELEEVKKLALCSVSSSLSVDDPKADGVVEEIINKHELKSTDSFTKDQCLRVGIAVGLMEEKLLKP